MADSQAGDNETPPVPYSPGRLRTRILLVTLLPMLLATTLLTGYIAARDLRRIDLSLDRNGQDVARRLAESASVAMPFGDRVSLKRIFDHEGKRPDSVGIGVLDPGGRWWLVSGEALKLPRPPMLVTPHHWRGQGFRFFAHPVISEHLAEPSPATALMGQVILVVSEVEIDAARAEVFKISASMLIGLLGIAALLAWWLCRNLSGPLETALAGISRLVDGDYGLRLNEDSPGELGELERRINRLAQTLDDNVHLMTHRIEAATQQLQTQKDMAEAAVLSKSKFLAAASHDLRQPLHAMSLLVSAMKEKVAPENTEAWQLANHIEHSTHSMEHLLTSLLDLSRLDAGAVVARPVCIPIAPILNRLRQQFEALAEDRGIELSIVVSRLHIFTDPALLERILVNLLSNAIRYTDHGKVLLGVRRVRDDWVRIEVHDTGRGIPEAYRHQIFEEYFQLENPERSRDKGLGLGLAIVKRLCQLIGSPIHVRSGASGTCFSLRAARCQPSRAPAAGKPPVPNPNGASLPGLVAFIEDDDSILEAMAILFEQWGIALAAGTDVSEVRAVLQRLGRAPDAILSDFRLRAGRNGLEAINDLRSVYGPDIPAALITGDTAPTTLQAIRASGLPMLHKPVKPANIRAFLHHLMRPDARPGN
jgi:signal transduction histidine kinase/CheY-like chemotaxis protein